MIFIKVGRALGQEFLYALQHIINIELVQSADGNNLCLGQCLVPKLDLLGQSLLVAKVYLVDEHKDGCLLLLDFIEEIAVLVGRFHHICDIKQDVGILQGTLAELEHLLLQLVVGLQDAWGVAETYLHLGRIEDAHDAMSSGLCLEGSNRNALTNQKVHER